jgi:hypothetical protein
MMVTGNWHYLPGTVPYSFMSLYTHYSRILAAFDACVALSPAEDEMMISGEAGKYSNL